MQNYRSGIHSRRRSNHRSWQAVPGLTCVAFFICCCTAVRANTLHVPSEFPTIQSALDAAVSGDSILVAQGTYMENLVWPQVSDIHLSSDPANATKPTIDGGSAGRVIDIETEGNPVFIAEISGFVVTHGFLDVPAHTGETGAGIFMNGGVLLLSKCVIRENVITSSFAIQNNGGGAGVSIVGTPAGSQNVIQDCAFLFNTVSAVTSGDGAAIHLDGAPALIRRTEVRGNRISVGEVALGTLYGFASDLSLDSVTIEENRAQTSVPLLAGFAAIKGTAVFSYLSKLDILNCKIANNSSAPQNSTLTLLGAAVYFYGEGTTLNVSSSSIAYNKRTDAAPVAGAAIFFSSLSPRTATVVNSILWNPSDGDEVDSFSRPALVRFSDVRDGTTDHNNLNTDPLFASQVDLHLQAGSACLDAGDNSSAPRRDIDGTPRPLPVGSSVDLGCYEME